MEGVDLADPGAGRSRVFAEAWRGQEYMVRTASQKLIWSQRPEQSQFFDLQQDPLEMDNRIDDPAYAQDVTALRDVLLQWALFDARSHPHVDPTAPVIEADNVPERGDGHAEAMADYVFEQMQLTSLDELFES
jgi:hypothetical protein